MDVKLNIDDELKQEGIIIGEVVPNVKKVILFGSVARGGKNPNDIDIALVVNTPLNSNEKKILKQMYNVTPVPIFLYRGSSHRFLLNYGGDKKPENENRLHLVIATENDMESKHPIIENIKREGQVLYATS